MPGVIGQLIGIVVLFARPPDSIDIQNLIASNPGVLVSSDSPKWMMELAKSLDLFTIWIIVLMGIGFSKANPRKISTRKAIGYIALLWGIYVLIKVGWVAAFS